LAPIAPYDDFFDPTGSGRQTSRITAIFYFPETEYLKSSPPKRFTSVTAICCPHPDQIASSFLETARAAGIALGEKPNGMHPSDRERLFSAMAAALGGTFVVSVAVPAALLWAGQKKPEITYRALCGMFLLPIIELHRTLKIEELHIHLTKVGSCTEKLKHLVQEILRGIYPKKGRASVELIEDNTALAVLAYMAQCIAWSVERLYKQPEADKKWISYFESKR
jgi:hypothetical protein